MSGVPTISPAGFTPELAVTFTDASGNSQQVRADSPLPTVSKPFVAPAALAGATATNALVGPFKPLPGRVVIVGLTGTWTGQVRVMRSTDNGLTRLPLTMVGQPFGVFITNSCEPVWEESEADAALYLDITLTSGTVTYRMGQ